MTRQDDRRGIDETVTAAATSRLALIACALMGGCDEPESATLDELAEAPTTTSRDAPPAVCPAGRMITMRTSDGLCSNIVGTKGTWTGAPLFTQEADGKPVETRLKRYCEYTWTTSKSAPPEPALLNNASHTGAASDCEVIWPQGDVLSEGLEVPLRDVFHAQLRRPTVLPATPATHVRIAVPDTASIADVEMRSKHARNMAAIIDSAACPVTGAACPRVVTRNLALPRIGAGAIDPEHGGFYGSQADLARAIRTAVDRWQVAPIDGNLVINLSLGWEPGPFGGTESPANMKASVRAVHDALQYAVCRGALVITAAGNVAGAACVDPGPLAPARWESLKGPSVSTCDALFGPGKQPPPADIATRPLVYAVGGVDHNDGPLMNARPNGRPRLAAPAFMAVVDDATGLTTALSGSSVAAAATSGTAALVWSYFPKNTPGQVMDRLYTHGKNLGKPAEFGVGGSIRRINGCRALTGLAMNCPETAIDLAPLRTAAEDLLVDLAAADLLDEAPAVTLDDVDSCSARCDWVDLYSPVDATAPCAENLVGETTRYTEPQPEWPDCPVCFISANVLHMSLSEQYSVATPVQVLLETSGDTSPGRYALGTVTLNMARGTDLPLPAAGPATPILRAILHLTFPDGRTASNAIPVL